MSIDEETKLGHDRKPNVIRTHDESPMIIVCLDDGVYEPVSSGYDVPHRITVRQERRLQKFAAELTLIGGDGAEEDERRGLIRPNM